MIQEFTNALESIEATDKALAGLCRLLDNDEVETIRYYRNVIDQMDRRIKAIMAHKESELLRKVEHAARPIGYIVIKSDLSQASTYYISPVLEQAQKEARALADKNNDQYAVCKLVEKTDDESIKEGMVYLVVDIGFLFSRNHNGHGSLEYFTQLLRLARYSAKKDAKNNDVPYSIYEVVSIKIPHFNEIMSALKDT